MVTRKPYELTASDVENLTELPVISNIPFDRNVQKSLAEGKPVILSNPYSPASREISKLAANVLGERYYSQGNVFTRLYYVLKNLF
jgi:MinD-like ATPase involved in chromosome partitioning or flagellar assembly